MKINMIMKKIIVTTIIIAFCAVMATVCIAPGPIINMSDRDYSNPVEATWLMVSILILVFVTMGPLFYVFISAQWVDVRLPLSEMMRQHLGM